MSYFTQVGFTNDKTLDAFGRLRTANPQNLVSGSFLYDLRPLRFLTSTTGAGTVVKTTNVSSATLSVGTASGDSAVLQSRIYAHYQPGKSQLIQITGTLGTAKANVQTEIGYNDALDGVFFRQANGARVVVRSSASGVAVDTEVLQANWNIDKMDGTGPSGININFSFGQLFVIDFQWLGAGRVRFGFSILGAVYYCHQFQFANTLSVPYSNTGSLPVRWRIANTGTAASGTSMTAVCAGVQSEGGIENVLGLPFSASNGITTTNVTTRRPILSIQVGSTFNGIVNRGQTVVDLVSALSGGGTCLFEIVLNGALTGASFSAVNATLSSTSFDVAATAITGGTVISQGYVSGNTDVTRGIRDFTQFSALDALCNNLAGTQGDTLSLVGTAITGTNVAVGVFLFHEVR